MLHRAIARNAVEGIAAREILYTNVSRALVQKRLYSQHNIRDLIDQTISETTASANPNTPPVKRDVDETTHVGERPLSQRLKSRNSGKGTGRTNFGNDISQLSLDTLTRNKGQGKKVPNRRNVKTPRGREGALGKMPEGLDVPEDLVGEMENIQHFRAEMGEGMELQEELRQTRGRGRSRRPGRAFESPPEDASSEFMPFSNIAAQPQPPRQATGRRGGAKGKSKRALLLGGEEEQAEVDEDLESKIGKEEFWDIDAEPMRVLRQMLAWRNPVSAEEPGEPALFHKIKSGYDIYAEGRTQFRLGDGSATWGTNGPTTSVPNMIGGPTGDYSTFLTEETKRVAGVDSAGLKPAEVIRLTLSRAVDMHPRQRENVVSNVESFLSNAMGAQGRQTGQ